MKHQSIENQLFTWDGWDGQDTMVFSFYKVVLVRDIGPFKKGDKFTLANMDYEKSIMELYKDDEYMDVHVFNLMIDAVYVGAEVNEG